MNITSNKKGKILPFKRQQMNVELTVIDSFDLVDRREGRLGVLYVLSYSDGSQRKAFLVWDALEDKNYDLLHFVKKEAEGAVTKDADGYAAVNNLAPSKLYSNEPTDSIVAAIKEWDNTPIDERKKKAGAFLEAHRPKNAGHGSAAKAPKISNG